MKEERWKSAAANLGKVEDRRKKIENECFSVRDGLAWQRFIVSFRPSATASFPSSSWHALTHSKNAVVRAASVRIVKMDSLDPMTWDPRARPSVQIKGEGAGTRPQVKIIFADLPVHAARFIA